MPEQTTVERELKETMKTGKVVLGSRRAVKLLLRNQVKALIVADNAPSNIRGPLESLAKLNGVLLYIYRGTSADLGSVIGKPFKVSSIAVLDPGDSHLLEVLAQQ